MHIADGHCLIIQLIVIEDLLGIVLGIHRAVIWRRMTFKWEFMSEEVNQVRGKKSIPSRDSSLCKASDVQRSTHLEIWNKANEDDVEGTSMI